MRSILMALVAMHALVAAAEPVTRNGFVLDSLRVPVEEILAGGPQADGIPALSDPRRLPARATTLEADAWVVGVAIDGEAVAYPVAILEWHEIVNDTIGGVPILVSYCPLCGTAMVFGRRDGEKVRSFGVSGLLYRSDLLLYDRETRSLWSQIRSEAVSGPASGSRLSLLRSQTMRWREWLEAHPGTSVLSFETGHRRPYGRSPYGDYASSANLVFPTAFDRRHHPKTPTLGLRIRNGAARAYPAVELMRAGGQVEEWFAGRHVRVAYDPEAERFRVEAPDDVEIVEGYWFAWMAFHPHSSVFEAGVRPQADPAVLGKSGVTSDSAADPDQESLARILSWRRFSRNLRTDVVVPAARRRSPTT